MMASFSESTSLEAHHYYLLISTLKVFHSHHYKPALLLLPYGLYRVELMEHIYCHCQYPENRSAAYKKLFSMQGMAHIIKYEWTSMQSTNACSILWADIVVKLFPASAKQIAAWPHLGYEVPFIKTNLGHAVAPLQSCLLSCSSCSSDFSSLRPPCLVWACAQLCTHTHRHKYSRKSTPSFQESTTFCDVLVTAALLLCHLKSNRHWLLDFHCMKSNMFFLSKQHASKLC